MQFGFKLFKMEFTFHALPKKTDQRWGFGHFINKERLVFDEPVPMIGLGPIFYVSMWPTWNGVRTKD